MYEFKVNENFIIYAFRYALGRSSYAVSEVSEYIIKHKDSLPGFAKRQIVEEIKQYLDRIHEGLYMQCDKDCWEAVVKELEMKNA